MMREVCGREFVGKSFIRLVLKKKKKIKRGGPMGLKIRGLRRVKNVVMRF
jgi:hypothetical protein